MMIDYPKFDKAKHKYIVSLAGGDGKEATCPIGDYIRSDQVRCAMLAKNAKEENEILQTSLDDWVDSLEVYDNDDNLIAEYRNQDWIDCDTDDENYMKWAIIDDD